MNDKDFIAVVYELAFGENAIGRDFSHGEVVEKLKEFSENAYKWEEEGGKWNGKHLDARLAAPPLPPPGDSYWEKDQGE